MALVRAILPVPTELSSDRLDLASTNNHELVIQTVKILPETRESVIVENKLQDIVRKNWESVFSWGYYVKTPVNQGFFSLFQLMFDA